MKVAVLLDVGLMCPIDDGVDARAAAAQVRVAHWYPDLKLAVYKDDQVVGSAKYLGTSPEGIVYYDVTSTVELDGSVVVPLADWTVRPSAVLTYPMLERVRGLAIQDHQW